MKYVVYSTYVQTKQNFLFEGEYLQRWGWGGGGGGSLCVSDTEYIFYYKRAILFLSSSNILTPHPPLRPASMSSPRNKGGGSKRHQVPDPGSGSATLLVRVEGEGGEVLNCCEEKGSMGGVGEVQVNNVSLRTSGGGWGGGGSRGT
jgi:hypothetical protein